MKYLIFFLFVSTFCFAQNTNKRDTNLLNKTLSDSLKNIKLLEATMLLQQADSIREADSLAKIKLIKELESLKTTDLLKKKELQNQLNDIAKSDSLRKLTLKNRIDSLKLFKSGFPVVPFIDTIFTVYTNIGPFSAKDRAETISRKINNLYESATYDTSNFKISKSESNIELYYDDIMILSITENDELWLNTKKDIIVDNYKKEIIKAIDNHIKETSLKKTLLRILWVIIILISLTFTIYIINRGFKYIKKFILKNKGIKFNGFKIKNYEILDSDKQIAIISFLLNLFRISIILITIYISLPLIFGLFPWTKGIADTLFSYILTPIKSIINSFVKYIPNLFTIIVIYFITKYIIKLVNYFSKEVETGKLNLPGFYQDWAKPTFNILKFIIYAFMFIVIYPYLPGSDSAIFQGVSVFLGILFSLGSSSAITNAVAGLVITYMRPFRIGDRIKIGDINGIVVEKTMLITRLKTLKNEIITVPNSSILNGYSINYSTCDNNDGLVLHTTVTIGYDVPWRKVHELLITAAKRTEKIDLSCEPFVLQTSLDDFYVSYELNAHTRFSKVAPRIYSDLHQNIQDTFNEAGVEILSPHYRAPRDGNHTTIPSEYLPEDYKAPGFRIEKIK